MLLAHGGGGEKSDSFSRWGEQDRPALWNRNKKQTSCNCSGGTVATGYYLTENPALRENDFQRPAKGGSTPAFACQHAAIAPLPCLNLQPWFSWFHFVWMGQFKKCNCSRENRLQNTICFANVGCSPTPRQHFWKTAAPKNFLFACGSFPASNSIIPLHHKKTAIETSSVSMTVFYRLSRPYWFI